MMPLAVISVLQYFFGAVLFVLSAFLVLLILVQRGRGGGLTGALGGPGGQSAFGTKAGDVFTRITIILAAIWIFLNALAVWSMQEKDFTADGGPLPTNIVSPVGNQEGTTIPTGMTGASDLGLGNIKDESGIGSTTPPTENATPEVTSETFPKEGADATTTPPAAGTPATETPAAGTPAADATPPQTPPAAGEPGTPPAESAPKTEGDSPK
jgi:preprotein translocase subunit SecG